MAISGQHPQPHSPIRWVVNENLHGFPLWGSCSHVQQGGQGFLHSCGISCVSLSQLFVPTSLDTTEKDLALLCTLPPPTFTRDYTLSSHFIPYQDTNSLFAAPSAKPHQRSSIWVHSVKEHLQEQMVFIILLLAGFHSGGFISCTCWNTPVDWFVWAQPAANSNSVQQKCRGLYPRNDEERPVAVCLWLCSIKMFPLTELTGN